MTCLGAFACKKVQFATLADFTSGTRIALFRRAALRPHPTIEALTLLRACEEKAVVVASSRHAIFPKPTIEALALPCAPVASAVPVAIRQHVADLIALPGVGIDLVSIVLTWRVHHLATLWPHPTFEALAHARAPVASAVPVAGSFHVARLDTRSGVGIDLAWLACLACEAGKTFLAVAGSHIIVGTHACIHHAKVVILSCFDVLPYPHTTV
jgi:hypothetical protein